MGSDWLGRLSLLPGHASSGTLTGPMLTTAMESSHQSATAAIHYYTQTQKLLPLRSNDKCADMPAGLQVTALLYMKTGGKVGAYFTSR